MTHSTATDWPMFIGHLAVALAAKGATPRTSLASLFVACRLSDLIWPVLLLAGVSEPVT